MFLPLPLESFVQILGASSATIAWDRYMTSQYLYFNGEHCLIDCGEGAQYQLKRYKVKYSKIKYIFISHLHGDHYFGLPGLLSSFSLAGRTEPLYIFAPSALREVLLSIQKASSAVFSFKINFIDTQPSKPILLLENDAFTVHSFPLDHRIECTGFLFKEKKKDNKLLVNKLPINFPFELMRSLKKGEVVSWNETVFSPNEYTELPTLPKSFAFCSDTAYAESILPIINGVDLLYHEATFNAADQERATKTRHSTAKQAATVALKANAKELIIGHFSIRYKELTELLEEARLVFDKTSLAEEGKIFPIK